MKTIYLTFEGIEFELEGVHNKEVPRTNEYPGDPENFEIYEIKICGNNVTGILSNDFDKRLQSCVNENIQSYL